MDSSPQADWYPDPQGAELQRYWDGTRWTDATRPLPPAPPPPAGPPPPGFNAEAPTVTPIGTPPTSGPSPALRALLIGGGIVGALVLIGAAFWVRAKIAEEPADLAAITCADLADEAVRISEEQQPPVLLLKVREPTTVDDNTRTYEVPTGSESVLVLSCVGTGVWSDGTSDDVRLRLTVDADAEAFVYYEPA
jgi:hypothetical protein